jgi:hypothetical protein
MMKDTQVEVNTVWIQPEHELVASYLLPKEDEAVVCFETRKSFPPETTLLHTHPPLFP